MRLKRFPQIWNTGMMEGWFLKGYQLFLILSSIQILPLTQILHYPRTHYSITLLFPPGRRPYGPEANWACPQRSRLRGGRARPPSASPQANAGRGRNREITIPLSAGKESQSDRWYCFRSLMSFLCSVFIAK